MKLLFVVVVGVFAFVTCGAEESVGPIVETSLGRILGSTKTSMSGRTFMAFTGLPYAEKPFRFQDPVPIKPWSKRFIFNGTVDAPICPQADLLSGQFGGQEDCLMLNIYTHQISAEKLTPVMVWIHGGGFQSGSGNKDFYGPDLFMDRDIVLVTINYRVGALGFFTTNSKEAPGNYGLLDQTMALKWVQEHIDRFGGDPNSVTIFGESAGGASVDYHLLSPLSKGLFHGAIAQSGTSACVWACHHSSYTSSRTLAAQIGCQNETDHDLIQCLNTKSAEDFVPIMADPFEGGGIYFMPRIDIERETPFFPAPSAELVKSGQFNHVPLIMGANRDEGTLFMGAMGLFTDPEKRKSFEEDPSKLLTLMTMIENDAEGLDFIQKILDQYLDRTQPIGEQLSEVTKIFSDRLILKGLDESLTLYTQYNTKPTYAYYYTHKGNTNLLTLFGLPEDFDAVSHGDELPMIFNGDFTAPPTSVEDLRVSKTLIDLWTSFASSGKPTSDLVPEWPSNSAKEPHYLDIKLEPEVVAKRLPFQDRTSKNPTYAPDNFCKRVSVKDEL